MTQALFFVMTLALVLIFCVRHFFIQLIALKLFLDSLVIILVTVRASNQLSIPNQASGWMIASIGTLSFFVMLAAGIRRFSTAKSLSLEAENE